MTRSFEQFHREVIRKPGLLRAGLSLIEPFYKAITAARNNLYDRGILSSRRAARPVICVGNITTGGTGKTPVVAHIARALIAAGPRPAVLLRGYKGGDEHRMLQNQLPQVPIEANPNRIAGAAAVLQTHPEVTVFLLDDGFQHRKLKRDFDLVLIDATNPFGFDHLLPRGLLRESLTGLSRASAFLITHADATPIEQTLRRYNSTAPIYRCHHVTIHPPGKKVLSFCGIGNPASFHQQVHSIATYDFDDHHHYSSDDLRMLRDRAKAAGAEMLVTTEKDWIKIAAMPGVNEGLPIMPAGLKIEFENDDERKLLDQITAAIASSPVASSPAEAKER